jgi:hypothetical protein
MIIKSREDKDFEMYSKYIQIVLHKAEERLVQK